MKTEMKVQMKLVIIVYCKMEFSENNMSENRKERADLREENKENRASENIWQKNRFY